MLFLSKLLSLLPFLLSLEFALSFPVCYSKSLAHSLVSCSKVVNGRTELLVELGRQSRALSGSLLATLHRYTDALQQLQKLFDLSK